MVLDCPSCGGPFPEGRRCCPHCHCSYSGPKKVTLAIAAAIGLAGCGDDSVDVDGGVDQHATPADAAYGVFLQDLSKKD